MVIKCNPKEIVDEYMLVDITSCMLKIEPLCHDTRDNSLIKEDGSPLFFELLAVHISTPRRWVERLERIKDGTVATIGKELPVTRYRLCIFHTKEEAYEALKQIELAIINGESFLDLS